MGHDLGSFSSNGEGSVALFVGSRMHRTLLAHMLLALHTSVVLKVRRIFPFFQWFLISEPLVST